MLLSMPNGHGKHAAKTALRNTRGPVTQAPHHTTTMADILWIAIYRHVHNTGDFKRIDENQSPEIEALTIDVVTAINELRKALNIPVNELRLETFSMEYEEDLDDSDMSPAGPFQV